MYSTREKGLAAISYIGWLFVLIVYLIDDSKKSEFIKHHLHQAVVLNIIASLSLLVKDIESLSAVLGIATTVFLVWGIVNAIMGSMYDIPVLDAFKRFNS